MRIGCDCDIYNLNVVIIMLEIDFKHKLELFIFIIGLFIGICLHVPINSIIKNNVSVKVDTITKEIVKSYTPLELKKNTYKIHVPKINIKEHVFIKVDSIIFKDSIQYVAIPRERYYTKQDNVEI